VCVCVLCVCDGSTGLREGHAATRGGKTKAFIRRHQRDAPGGSADAERRVVSKVWVVKELVFLCLRFRHEALESTGEETQPPSSERGEYDSREMLTEKRGVGGGKKRREGGGGEGGQERG
jgi:hypothetical protein